MTKAIGIFCAVIIGIMLLPVAIGLIGGVFGLIAGILGGLFGAIVGVIGGLFGAIFGVIGWFFDMLFGWDGDYWDFSLDLNFFTVTLLVIVIAYAIKSRRQQNTR